MADPTTIHLPSRDRESWLAERRTGIGGSDAPAVLGVSRFDTPLGVYLDKRGERPPKPDTSAMAWGRRLEPLIRDAYADATGRTVRVPTTILRHPHHPYMIGSIDGVTDDARLLEIKTARTSEDWGEAGTDQVPDAYLVQVQHYLAVTGLRLADVAVLIGGSDFRLYEVPADPELQATLEQIEAAFWGRVQRGEPPDPVTYEDATTRWRISTARMVQADPATRAALEQLRAANAAIKQFEAEADRLKTIVCAALGEADTLADGETVLATWKTGKAPERFDAKALQAAQPDLYRQFVKTGEPSRRFLLKGE